MSRISKICNALTFWRSALLAVLLAGSTFAFASGAGEKLAGSVASKPEGSCVRETSYMRKNHMDELKHHRDDTMRKGIRTKDFSLQNCIECHASQDTRSVLGKDGFCQKCHTRAAVSMDCFECHSSKPKSATKFHKLGNAGVGGKTSDLAGKMRSELEASSAFQPADEVGKQ